jgi:CDP-paratose 2-epimerase
MSLFEQNGFDLVIHCAAQPSHDKAKEIPLVDFEVNAVGTLNLLEATRQHCPDAVFIMMSTNKVYGDAPNGKLLKELATRYDYSDPADFEGIDETCRIDRTLHSIFGASKVAADVMAQEYGRYFGLKVGVFRGGCLTGPSHSGVELHGFLSYLVKVAVTGQPYTVYGYKGKQVRDNIHSYDVIRAMEEFAANPRPGEVYNLGGGRANSVSMVEAIERIDQMSGCKLNWTYNPQNRKGDHICYISDLRKLRAHYPKWTITRSLDLILSEIIETQKVQLGTRT